jgi:hypothetical protein
MSEENNVIPAVILPALIKASGSDKTIEVNPANWADPQGFLDYLLGYACGVILQRASAGKNDDAEKAAKAVDSAIERLQAGVVPAGGGFTKLSPEDYAMKETLMASKVKFEKGESVTDVLGRLAVKLTEAPEVADDATDEEKELAAEVFAELCVDTQTALVTELEGSEVYKSALKARKAKAKTATVAGSLMGKL